MTVQINLLSLLCQARLNTEAANPKDNPKLLPVANAHPYQLILEDCYYPLETQHTRRYCHLGETGRRKLMLDLSESFVASIAKALTSEQIPCVLWGHYLLQVHGVPSIIGSIDFVIPDEHLKVGTTTVTQFKGLTQCSDQEVCPTSSKERFTPPPAFHVHTENPEVTVGLYPQSDTLWFLPQLDCSFLPREKRNLPPEYIFASDQTVLPPWRPGRGSGVFKSDCNPVIVPKSHILLEAFLRLYARDSGKRIGGFAMSMICYMEQYVDDDGLLDAELLPEPLKTFYRDLRQGKKPVRQWTKELKLALGIPLDGFGDD